MKSPTWARMLLPPICNCSSESPPSSRRTSSITPLRGTITECDGSCWPIGIEHTAAVAVGRDGAQLFAFGFKQHAVQVITHVLMGHRELGGFNQAF